jgi:hypothetical protein
MLLPPTITYLDLFPFDNLGNVDNTGLTHGTLPWLNFAFIVPFVSTLHTNPLCHSSSLRLTLNNLH